MSKEQERMKQDIVEMVEMFGVQVSYLGDLYELQRELTAINENDVCPDAIQLINGALYDAAFITLSKIVVDDDRQTISIWGLLKKMEDNCKLFNSSEVIVDSVNRCKNKLEEEKEVIKRIKERRDTLIAHNDKKYYVHPEKYNQYMPNYVLWRVAKCIENFIKEIEGIIGIEDNTNGKYKKSNDFREIIEIIKIFENLWHKHLPMDSIK